MSGSRNSGENLTTFVLDYNIGFNSNGLYLLEERNENINLINNKLNKLELATTNNNNNNNNNSNESKTDDETFDYIFIGGSVVKLCSLNSINNQKCLRGHKENIVASCISPNRKLLATAECGDTPDICVWNIDNSNSSNNNKFKMLHKFEEHRKGISILSFSTDSRFLASVGTKLDKRLFIWDMESGYIVASSNILPLICNDLKWGGRVKDIKKRPTKDYLFASCGYDCVLLWVLQASSGELISQKCNTSSFHRDFKCLAFSPTNDILVIGTTSGDFLLLDVKQLKIISSYNCCAKGVNNIYISPMLSKDRDYILKSLNPQLYFRIMCCGGDGTISVFEYDDNIEKYDCINKLNINNNDGITCLDYNNKYNHFIIGTKTGNILNLNNYIDNTSINNNNIELVSQNESVSIVDMSFDNINNDRFVTINKYGLLKYWKYSNDNNTYKYNVCYNNKNYKLNNDNSILCLDINDEIALSGDSNGTIQCYNLNKSNDYLWSLKSTHKNGVTKVRLSSNSKYLVSSGCTGTLRLWDLRYRKLVTHLKEHKQYITGLELYNDSIHGLTCSKDRSFICWDFSKQCRISSHRQQIGQILDISLTYDETVVLTCGTNNNITFWDIRQQNYINNIVGAHNNNSINIINTSKYKNNNLFVSASSKDCIIKLWDIRNYKLLNSNTAHSNGINEVKFSPDSKQLISVGNDGNIMIWNIY